MPYQVALVQRYKLGQLNSVRHLLPFMHSSHEASLGHQHNLVLDKLERCPANALRCWRTVGLPTGKEYTQDSNLKLPIPNILSFEPASTMISTQEIKFRKHQAQ